MTYEHWKTLACMLEAPRPAIVEKPGLTPCLARRSGNGSVNFALRDAPSQLRHRALAGQIMRTIAADDVDVDRKGLHP